MKLEISCNMIEGRIYMGSDGKKYKWDEERLWVFIRHPHDENEFIWNIAENYADYSDARKLDFELLPNIPDENTPQGIKVLVSNNESCWANCKFLCINKFDEYKKFVVWDERDKLVISYKYCEIVEG